MNGRQRFKRWVSLGFALGALAIPAAQAGTRPDDRSGPHGAQPIAADASEVVSRYLRNHPTSTRPDDRAGPLGVGQASASVPDVFERYAAAHPYGSGLSDAAEAAGAVSLTSSGGFDWGDYGAGVGTGIGVVLLLAGALMAMPVWRRQRTQSA